jgi:Nif-specific regulatory protein
MIASAVLMETEKTLRLASAGDLAVERGSSPGSEGTLLSLEEVERRHITRILDSVGGNRTQAATILGIGLRTLQRKLKEYDDSTRSK